MGREGFRKRSLPCPPSPSQLQQGMAEIHKNSLGSLRGVVKEAEKSQQGYLWGDRVQGTECAAEGRNHGVGSTREGPGMGPDSSSS